MYPWNKFPYSNLNKLNLAWIINEVQGALSRITALEEEVDDIQQKEAYEINVKEYGAKGDGVTDDTAAIKAAIAFGASLGYEVTIKFPSGNYVVSDQEEAGILTAIYLNGVTGLRLNGDGQPSTTITLANAGEGHVIGMIDCENIYVSNMTINGNAMAQTLGVHGIRNQNGKNIHIENVDIYDTVGYGIGVQNGDDGITDGMHIQNVRIVRPGADGIDIKDPVGGNKNIVIDNVYVYNPSYLSAVATNVGVDVRGANCLLSNITVENVRNLAGGIRFREASLDYNSGRKSSLTNFTIKGRDVTSFGLYVNGYENSVNGGHIEGVGLGLLSAPLAEANGKDNTVENVQILNCASSGLFLQEPAKRFTLSNVTVDGSEIDNARIDADDVTIKGCKFINSVTRYGINITPTADRCRVIDCNVEGNAGLNILESGTNITVKDTLGWATKETLISEDLAIDSVGQRGFTVNHNLGVTPKIQDVSLQVLENSNFPNEDTFTVTLLKVDVANSSLIQGRMVVGTASGTAGAVANVGIKIDSERR